MPEVTVKVFATLRDSFREKSFKVLTPAQNVKELIGFIDERYSRSFKATLLNPETGQFRKLHKVLVNGRDIYFLKGLETELHDGDTIAFFPLIGGG